jgi:hypothetical protein
MTSFEPFLNPKDEHFRANTMPELGLSTAENSRNFFTSQLSLNAGETYLVLLRDPPEAKFVPISPFGRFDDKSLTRTLDALDSIVNVKSDKPEVANVIFKQNAGRNLVYEITSKGVSGVALIQAQRFSGASLANLRVTILAQKLAFNFKAVKADELLGAIVDFAEGFWDGFSPHIKPAALAILAKSFQDPKATAAFPDAVNAGMLKGFQEGANAFLDLLKGIVNFVFDSKFREQIAARANEFVDAWIAATAHFLADPKKYLANAKSMGRMTGGELGTDINAQIGVKTLAEIGQWVGRILGLVLFEIILAVLTELIGMGVVQGARWIGENAAIVARLVPKIRPLLGSTEDIKVLLRARIGKTGKAVEEAGAMAGPKASRTVSRIMKGAEVAPRKFTAAEARTLTAKIASRMKQLGIPEANVGIRGIADESGEAFTAWGRARGSNVRGKGISVHGSVDSAWTDFPEWNAASLDTRIDAVIAHEWMEFNDLTHFETVELATESKLPISPDAKKLLAAMAKRTGKGVDHLLNEP